MTQIIIGRKKEKIFLKQFVTSGKAEFLALYGRRRVGKTFLIKHFFDNEPCHFFYCSGLKDGKLSDQLEEFAKQIGDAFYGGAAIMARKRWRDAFEDLNKAIAQLPPKKKIVLFFDELPWMATPRSGLLQTIDYYWNRYWSHNNRLKLIVCGSSAIPAGLQVLDKRLLKKIVLVNSVSIKAAKWTVVYGKAGKEAFIVRKSHHGHTGDICQSK